MSPEEVKKKLQEKYTDGEISVTDLTGTQDHYQVEIISNFFSDMKRIEQHKNVMDTFAAELKSGEVHALSIKTKTRS